VDKAAIEKSKLTTPVEYTPIETDDAKTVFQPVLKCAGASLVRDAVDKRIIAETKSGKEKSGASFDGGGKGIIDSQADVGGWPVLKSEAPPKDSDNDGMPDKWEKENGLQPDIPDNNSYLLNSDYTNLEVYINSLLK
jgi:hypothetical protein